MPWYKFTRSRGTPPALISTLNPALLRPSDHFDFSHHEEVIIRFPRSPQRTYALFRYCSLDHRQTAPFPADCMVFLYYWTPQDKDRPPLRLGLEGSVRLRLTSDPSSFEAGEDLRLPTGAPFAALNLAQEVWFNSEAAVNHWVGRGVLALEALQIPLVAGVRG